MANSKLCQPIHCRGRLGKHHVNHFLLLWFECNGRRALDQRTLFSPTIVREQEYLQAIAIYIDADACPVKQEVYRVAERHARKGVVLKVFVVSNSPIAVPREEMIERVVVGAGMDEADTWIAERAGRGDVVITADVPLASRCVKAGAAVIAPSGKAFTAESIGMTLATRNLIEFAAQRRRDHEQPEAVRAARSLKLPRGAGSGAGAAQRAGFGHVSNDGASQRKW